MWAFERSGEWGKEEGILPDRVNMAQSELEGVSQRGGRGQSQRGSKRRKEMHDEINWREASHKMISVLRGIDWDTYLQFI